MGTAREARTDRAVLEALAADGRLGELSRHMPPLLIARAFGVAHDISFNNVAPRLLSWRS